MGVLAFFRERVPIHTAELQELTNEPIPGHLKRWWFALGGTPLYLFVVQAATGILLTFYYVPEPGRAWESVRTITDEVAYGWYFRSLHKWAANMMVVAVVLHAMRVFFTGAYRRPRELNWVIGSVLLGVTLFFGFTGYSLVYEQLSFWGATVASNLTEQVPIVGHFIANLIRGGDTVGPNTLTRFFIGHIGVLPTAMTLLLAMHVLLIRLHGVTTGEFEVDVKEGKAGKTFPLFPDHALTELIIGVTLMILLSSLALIFPAALGERANPLVTPQHIKPEWYFFFTFRWLKLVGLTSAVLSLGAFGFLFVAWPFIDRGIRAIRKGSEASVWIGVLVVIGVLVLTVWEALAH